MTTTKQSAKRRLTLTIDEAMIREAKKLAEESGKSVSQIFEEYLLVSKKLRKVKAKIDVAPEVRALRGILKGTRASRELHHEDVGRKAR